MEQEGLQRQQVDQRSPERDLTVIEHEGQIKALSNPERVRILTLLIERPGTAKQVADWIGGTRGRVHYHVKELEKAGLVRIVAKVEKGGVLEKYYRAVARNFYVARGIGEHAGLSGDVQRVISESMLGWRRKQILEIDQDEIAVKVARDCLQIKVDDVVLIKGEFVHRDIMEPLSRAFESLGAHCLVTFGDCSDDEYILKWKEDLAAVIVIEQPVHYPGEESGTIDQQLHGTKRLDFMKGLVARGMEHLYAGVPGYPLENPVCRALLDAGKRIIYMGYPTPEKAEVMGLDYRHLHDAWWTALDVDYQALAERCRELGDLLSGSREVRITSPGGGDLTFLVEGREVFLDDGIISDWEVERGRGWGHLPAGKVIVAPVAGTANGTMHSEMTDYFGVAIRDIRIEFKDGEIVSASAGENEELLALVLSESSSDSGKAGGFEIGANPEVRNPVGYTVWDSKSYGDAALWIGDNRLIGGENEATLSWGFMIVRPTVYLDGRKILEEREFDIRRSTGT